MMESQAVFYATLANQEGQRRVGHAIPDPPRRHEEPKHAAGVEVGDP
jgi:hypothetical protein